METLFNEPSCLETNPFFVYLTREQKQLYGKLSKSQYTICIPSCNSLRGMKFNKEMILLHTLQKSPYYKGEYALLQNDEQSVIIENQFLNLSRGWRKSKVLKIISTQVFFNDDFNPYDILIIEKPFIWFLNEKKGFRKQVLGKKEQEFVCSVQKRKQEITKFFPKNLIYSQVENFWRKIGKKKIRSQAVKQFFSSLKKFKNSYYLVKRYESHLEKKLTVFYDEQVKLLIRQDLILRTFSPKSHYYEKLVNSLKILILGKLEYWGKIKDFYQYEDQFCAQQIQLLKKITPDILEIPEKLVLDYSQVIENLQLISNYNTAFEKILLIDKSIILLNEIIENNFLNSVSITTDDLIPIFSYIIIKSKIPNLFSTSVYLNHFHLCNMITSKYSFEITLLNSIVNNLLYSQKLLNIYQNFKHNHCELLNNKEKSNVKKINLNKNVDNDINLENDVKKNNIFLQEKKLHQKHSLQIVEII
ncbi:ankyrin repeat domain-containing protein [Anaeramoeba flamelloides]|uniref:Ankyrin repeat domain-containing protein n=1 Tax=Anaeramoeba flamelloides TaxID=1746091 RepID=A0ABQ8ZB91_9EUKA|nr:ankyrin repeat domain-containing protein [Anaeramoeba flamelloides]